MADGPMPGPHSPPDDPALSLPLSLVSRRPQAFGIRLTLAALTVSAALGATEVARTSEGFGTFVFSILGIAIVAWLGGMAVAFPATALLAVVTAYFWMDPAYSPRITNPRDVVSLVAFVAAALLIAALVDALRRLEERWHAQAMELAKSHHRQAALMADAVRAREDAESASRAKTQFLTLMSHELRTPLNAIIGYEQLLHDEITGPVSAEQRKQLSRIKASAVHLLALIDEILTLSKIEAGKETLTLEAVNLDEMLDEVGNDALPLAARKRLEVRVGPCERGLTVPTDRRKVKQVLLNLISNAVKFTDRGVVELVAEREPDSVLIHVRDSGIGIAPEHLPHVWEPFWRAQQHHARQTEGTGLGLSVSKRLARFLGGDLTVDSEPGRGTTFTLRLPLVGPA
jgi:signal transduction histidine kinase